MQAPPFQCKYHTHLTVASCGGSGRPLKMAPKSSGPNSFDVDAKVESSTLQELTRKVQQLRRHSLASGQLARQHMFYVDLVVSHTVSHGARVHKLQCLRFSNGTYLTVASCGGSGLPLRMAPNSSGPNSFEVLAKVESSTLQELTRKMRLTRENTAVPK